MRVARRAAAAATARVPKPRAARADAGGGWPFARLRASSPALGKLLEREMRSNYAGEVGAVAIYEGALRADPAFATASEASLAESMQIRFFLHAPCM